MGCPIPKFCDQCGGPVFWDLVTNCTDHSCEEWRQAGRDEHDSLAAELETVRAQLRAAEAVVDLVRKRQCCDGDDALQTAWAKSALAAYKEARRGGPKGDS